MGKKKNKKKKSATQLLEERYDNFEIGNDTLQDIEADFHHIFERYSTFQEEFVHSKFMEYYRHNLKHNDAQMNDGTLFQGKPHINLKKKYFDATASKEKLEAQPLFQFRKKLPAFERRIEISQMIRSNQLMIISGETGRYRN